MIFGKVRPFHLRQSIFLITYPPHNSCHHSRTCVGWDQFRIIRTGSHWSVQIYKSVILNMHWGEINVYKKAYRAPSGCDFKLKWLISLKNAPVNSLKFRRDASFFAEHVNLIRILDKYFLFKQFLWIFILRNRCDRSSLQIGFGALTIWSRTAAGPSILPEFRHCCN